MAITGLRGGVGASLACQVLLQGAKKVTLHHPDENEAVTEETVEACGGLLRESDVGDGLPVALGRRLRAWVLAEGARAGGGAEGGRVEVLGPDPVEGSDSFAAADAVITCDGSGPLSVIAGLGEAARRRRQQPGGRRQIFILAQARGLVGTVFVDSGDPAVAQTLYQSLRPAQQRRQQNTQQKTGERRRDGLVTVTPGSLSHVERRRQEVLHAEFLRSHPETRPLIPPKKNKTTTDDDHEEEEEKQEFAELARAAADAEGTSPAPLAMLVSAFAVTRLARVLPPPGSPAAEVASSGSGGSDNGVSAGGEKWEESPPPAQWFHLDAALTLRRPPGEIAAAAAMVALEEESSSLPGRNISAGDHPDDAGGGYEAIPDGSPVRGNEAGASEASTAARIGGSEGGVDDVDDVDDFFLRGAHRDGEAPATGDNNGTGKTGGRVAGSRDAVQTPLIGADVQRRLGGLQVLVLGGASLAGGAAIAALAGAGVGAGRGGCLAVVDPRRGGDVDVRDQDLASMHPLMCAANPGDFDCVSAGAVCAAAAAECYPGGGNIRALNLPPPSPSGDAAAALSELLPSFDVVVEAGDHDDEHHDGGGDDGECSFSSGGGLEAACRTSSIFFVRASSMTTTRVAGTEDVVDNMAAGSFVAGALVALHVMAWASTLEREQRKGLPRMERM